MINKNIYTKIGISLGIFILLIANVLAFGVGSQYWEEYPFTISPGETKDIYVTLQNMAGAEDISATGTITKGSEIAWITDADKTYLVPTGGEKVKVNIRVSVPEDAQIGDINELITSFTIKEAGAGPLGIGSNVEREIPIVITETPKKEAAIPAWIIYLIAGIILLILIIVIIILRKKKK